MGLIKPKLKDQALLNDIREAAGDKSGFHLWWLGQSGFLVQWQGKHLLLDPYLSDSLTKKYARTEKPHTRMTELVVDPAKLDFIDIVTSSHNHTDHLDGETLIPLIKANPNIRFIIPEANRDFVANRVQTAPEFPTGLNDREKITIAGFTITGVPAAHEALDRDEAGHCLYMGYVVQFGSYSIYHSGDTLYHDDIVEQLKVFGTFDLALLPINGRDPKRKVAGNLNAQQAVQVSKEINARMTVPCHYDMFTFNTADPKDFEKIAQSEEVRYKIMECGERISINH